MPSQTKTRREHHRLIRWYAYCSRHGGVPYLGYWVRSALPPTECWGFGRSPQQYVD
jgi:hypothetical protein